MAMAQVLVRSLRSAGTGPAAKEAAAWAIATLAVHSPARQPIIAAGALPALHALSKDGVRATREAAIVAHEMLNGRGDKGRPVLAARRMEAPAAAPPLRADAAAASSTEAGGSLARQLFAEEGAAAAAAAAAAADGCQTSATTQPPAASRSGAGGRTSAKAANKTKATKAGGGWWGRGRDKPSAAAAKGRAASAASMPSHRIPSIYTVSSETPPVSDMAIAAV